MRWIAAVLMAAMAASPAAAQRASESVRVATYNAFLLSPFFKCFNPNFADCLLQVEGETETWANALADAILADASRFDIIVLNEVWDQDAKNILVNRLGGTFPVWVKELDFDLLSIQARVDQFEGTIEAQAGLSVKGEDSGLMLFARGFEALPLPDGRYRWGDGQGQLEASTPEVAFTLFGSCAMPDCMSAKGAGMIRLRHRSGRVFNVVFTHLQADYPEDDEFHRTIRGRQFRDMRRMIERTLAPLGDLPTVLARERLLVMGDLNVAPLTTGRQEWRGLFDRQGQFWTDRVYDAWARTTSPDDRGVTHEIDAERLDYILAAGPVPTRRGNSAMLERQGFCVQHMTTPVDFRALESDHFMVHADTNRLAPFCSPSLAYRVNLAESGFLDMPPGGGPDRTTIQHPGGMQWFVVDAPGAGTYTISHFPQADVRVTVYAADDLTRPVSRFNKTTQTVPLGRGTLAADKYVLPPKFYVRVAGANRTFSGDYTLRIHKHSCATKEEACLLQPGQAQTARLSGTDPGQSVGGPQNEAWFRFVVTGEADSGQFQTISVRGSGLPSTPFHTASIEDWASAGGGPLTITPGSPFTATGDAGDGASGYLVMKQGQPGPQAITVTGLYDTDLRELIVGQLVCRDETNPETGSDEIYSRFAIDGTQRRVPSAGYMEFDCDEPQDSKTWGPLLGQPSIAFVDSLRVKVLEEDDVSADDDSRWREVEPLASGDTARDGWLEWHFDDGHYRMRYELRRRPNQPVE